ncbi:MAG: CHASE domain-containing protein [Cyanobacteria bacterium Co-bin13]|nr:CHASE domain-containing protein [Cyanobacteria bacterium Co-bin13]
MGIKRLFRSLPTTFTLFMGLGLTLSATLWVGRWERLTRQSEFQKQIDNLTTSLQRTTNRYNELLLSVGDLYRVADNQVSRQDFHRFVQRALRSYPGIQALEWAPRVTAAERLAYEQALAAQSGWDQASIFERDGAGAMVLATQRSEYIPVTYVEPWQGNEVALGYDLASDATRQVALKLARDTGAIAFTARIQLVQETADNQYSFLVFLPVYSQPAPTLAARQQHLEGYILGVFRVADVVEEALQDLNFGIDFYLYDQTASPNERFLGFYDSALQRVVTTAKPMPQAQPRKDFLCSARQTCTQSLYLGQREWRIVFLPSAAYQLSYFPWGTLATLLIGLLLTSSLLIYLSRWQAELERTRELSDLKLRLFSMASHELRTPLSIILVSAQSLEANRAMLTPTQQTNTIERIQTAAKRLSQLVSDILTLTRAEAGKLEFTPEIVELTPFCWQIVDEVQTSLNPGQHLLFEPPTALPKAFLDKKLLRSILLNLLSNAAKYSPADGKIQLQVSLTSGALQFQVIDQGIGIPPQAQDQIFEAFYRGNNVGTVQGTGLGLAVVKTCVDLHNGQLAVSSQPGEGTTVKVVLPWVE